MPIKIGRDQILRALKAVEKEGTLVNSDLTAGERMAAFKKIKSLGLVERVNDRLTLTTQGKNYGTRS